MPASEIITLGVGTPSDIAHLVLTGLGVGETPPVPPEPVPGGGVLTNIPAIIFVAGSGADLPETGDTFALPAYATTITWETSYGDEPSAAEINLQVSLDNIHFAAIDQSTDVLGEVRTIRVSASFVRIQAQTATDGGDIKVTILATREKL